MKHHCHCGFHSCCQRFHAGKLGAFGGVLVVLHLLYHVVECLILPAIFVGASGHIHHVDAAAVITQPSDYTDSKSLLEPGANILQKTTLLEIDLFVTPDFYQTDSQ